MGSGPEVVVSRTYTSNPHNPILTPPIRIIFVTTTMRYTLISACLIGWASASCSSVLQNQRQKPAMTKTTWQNVSQPLKDMIDICSTAGKDDPHAADWLTGTWLEEQLNGQRHLAGLI